MQQEWSQDGCWKNPICKFAENVWPTVGVVLGCDYLPNINFLNHVGCRWNWKKYDAKYKIQYGSGMKIQIAKICVFVQTCTCVR